MPRINSVTPEEAGPKVKLIFDALKKKNGKIANIFLHMGTAPAVLEGYVALSDAANHTSLNPLIREQIALAVSQSNQCNYCLSAHTAIGKAAGLKEDEILSARKGVAKAPKEQALLTFAKLIAEKNGKIEDKDLEALKKAGVNDEEILDVLLVVIQTTFTNYFNHLADPQIDFPKVSP